MHSEPYDPRDLPILTDVVERDGPEYSSFDAKAVHAALVTESLELASSLLHQATKDIEAALFERLFDELRARLPELVDRVLRQHAAAGYVPEPDADLGTIHG
jgi:hypothetical protein